MLTPGEARAALRQLGYRLSPYKGGFVILDRLLNYLHLEGPGKPRELSLEEVSSVILELSASGGQRGERRSIPRKSVREEAKVITDWHVLDCVVRDITDAGARLEIATPAILPRHFRLHLTSESLVVAVELEWQRGNAAGVWFSGVKQNPAL